MATEIADPKSKVQPRLRRRVLWVLFKFPVAASSGHSRVPMLATEQGMDLYLDLLEGETVISVEGPSFATPGIIPWANVASIGMMP